MILFEELEKLKRPMILKGKDGALFYLDSSKIYHRLENDQKYFIISRISIEDDSLDPKELLDMCKKSPVDAFEPLYKYLSDTEPERNYLSIYVEDQI